MKKVTCNEYYSVSVPVVNFGSSELLYYDLGLFVDEKDAKIAGQLFAQAIQFAGVKNMPKKVYKPIISPVLVAENQYTPFYLDISSFLLSNKLVYNYVKLNETYANAIIKSRSGYDARYEQIER